MSLLVKIIISVAVAAVASAATTFYVGDTHAALVLFIAFSGATIVTTLLVSIPVRKKSTTAAQQVKKRNGRAADKSTTKASSGDASQGGAREHGTVKWFNVSKGFGFITKQDGEEIFVHFRSIRGGGRRGLRDGQAVTFVVRDSDKGPQAEDVEGLQ